MKISLLKKTCALLACVVISMQGIASVSAANVKVFSGDEEVGYWAPCTDTLKLLTDAEENAEIKLSDLGASVLYESESDVELTAVSEDDGITLQLAESLKEGHKYRLSVDGKEISFKATTTGGKAAVSDRIDFSGLTDADLNNAPDVKPEKGSYVTGDDGLLVSKNASETRISIKDDESASGGKVLAFLGRGTLDKAIKKETNIYEGKVRVDARIDVSDGGFEMGIGNDQVVIPILTASETETKLSYQSATTTVSSKKIAGPMDGYVTISYEMDLDNKSVSYTINGEEGILEAGKMPYRNSKGNLLTNGAGIIQIEGTAKADEYKIDYLTTTFYADAPDVEKMTLIDIDGNAVSRTEDTEIRPEIQRIDIKFNNNMEEENLSYITVTDKDGNEVETVGEYNDRAKTYSLTLPEYLGAFGEYVINIPKEETGIVYDYSETIKTGDGKLSVADFYITDEQGNKISTLEDVTDKVIVNVSILNTKLEEGNMTIVYTEGKDKLMTKMLSHDIEISKDDRTSSYTFEVEIEDKTEINEIKAFLWNNIEQHIPQSKAVYLY